MTNVTTNLTCLHCQLTVSWMSHPFERTVNVVLFVLSVVIVASNSLTLLAFCRTPVLKTLQNKYIVALAVADMTVGLSLLSLLIQIQVKPPQMWIECQYNTAILYSSITFSLFILLSVSVDRYVYILHPFFYRRHATPRRSDIGIILQWLLASAHGFQVGYLPKADDIEICNPLAAFQTTFVRYVFPVIFLVVCTVISVLYALIARVAKAHWDKKVKRLRQAIKVSSLGQGHTARKQVQLVDGGRIADECSPREELHPSAESLVLNKSKLSSELLLPSPAHVSLSRAAIGSANIGFSAANDDIICINATDECQQRDDLCQRTSPIATDSEKISTVDRNASEPSLTDLTYNLAVTKINRPLLNDHTQVTETAVVNSSDVANGKDEPDRLQVKVSLRSLKWLKQMVIVFGLFLLCWSPIMITTLLSFTHYVSNEVTDIFSIFGVANSVGNFFVYSLHNRHFRLVILRWFKCKCCK